MPCFSLNPTIDSSSVTVVGGEDTVLQTFTVTVPEGKTPISGGYDTPIQAHSPSRPINLYSSYPTSDGTGWTFVFQNLDSSNHSVPVYVVYIDG